VRSLQTDGLPAAAFAPLGARFAFGVPVGVAAAEGAALGIGALVGS